MSPARENRRIEGLTLVSVHREALRPTAELTRPRGSVNSNLQKLHAKHAPAARVQRFVRRRLNENSAFRN